MLIRAKFYLSIIVRLEHFDGRTGLHWNNVGILLVETFFNNKILNECRLINLQYASNWVLCYLPSNNSLYFSQIFNAKLSAKLFFQNIKCDKIIWGKKKVVNINTHYCNFFIWYITYKDTGIFVHLYEVKADEKRYNTLISQLP